MKNLLILIMLILISCGTRKVQRTEHSEIIKKDSTSKTKEITNTETDIISQNTTEYENFTLTPMDSTKPIEIKDATGKVSTYKNAVLRHEKRLAVSKVIKAEKVAQIKTSEVKKAVTSKVIDSKKETDRKSFNWLWLIWIIIPIAILYAYWRYKDHCHNI